MRWKSLSVLIVPDNGDTVRRFRLSISSVYAIGAGAVSVAAFVLLAGGVYWNSHQLRGQWTATSLENEVLQADLGRFQEGLAEVESRLEASVQMENRARLLAGLHPLDEETRQLGIGGPDLAIPQRGVDPGLSAKLNELDGRLDSMRRHVNFQEQSYRRVLHKLRERHDRIERTPTIAPVIGDFFLSSDFGRRADPFTGRPSMHMGHDYSAPEGVPFVATARGTVVFAGSNGDFGVSIRVDHGDGIETVYCHAGKTLVQVGDEVERGQEIGLVGATGRTTGPHMHYEVRVDGQSVDPRRFILDQELIVD